MKTMQKELRHGRISQSSSKGPAGARRALHARHSSQAGAAHPVHGKSGGAVVPKNGLAVSGQADGIHCVQRELVEAAFYPPHSPRTERTAYGAIHDQLVHTEDRPCVALVVTGMVNGVSRTDLNFTPVPGSSSLYGWSGDGAIVIRNSLLTR